VHLSAAKKLSSHILENFSEEKKKKCFANSCGLIGEKKTLVPEQINGISFCIPTNAKRVEKTLLTIESIKKQNWNIPYEIIICGDIEKFSHIDKVRTLDRKNEAHSKKVSALRNGAASLSSYETIVFCDDDIILSDDWLERTLEFSEKEGWEVLGNKIFNPDGTRHWDKATLFPRKLVDYNHPDSDSNLMQTSGFFLIRKNILKQIPWDETKLVYGDRENNGIPEDVQFHFDMKNNNVMLKFNKMACVWHNDDSYTEFQGQTLSNKDIFERFNIDFENEKNQKFVDLLLRLKGEQDG
jgi:glycosyltransferase involved in cell wall biosynthesis